jgi:hypothetical protein
MDWSEQNEVTNIGLVLVGRMCSMVLEEKCGKDVYAKQLNETLKFFDDFEDLIKTSAVPYSQPKLQQLRYWFYKKQYTNKDLVRFTPEDIERARFIMRHSFEMNPAFKEVYIDNIMCIIRDEPVVRALNLFSDRENKKFAERILSFLFFETKPANEYEINFKEAFRNIKKARHDLYEGSE